MVVSYTLPIVTIALSLTIRLLQSATLSKIEGGSLWVKILGCSLWIRSVMLGYAESEQPRLTNLEIIFEEFQPM